MQTFSDAHKAIKLCPGEWSTEQKAERRENEVLESIICLSPFWLLPNATDWLINKRHLFSCSSTAWEAQDQGTDRLSLMQTHFLLSNDAF